MTTEKLKPGQREKCEEKGWFIVNDEGNQIFLCDDKEGYIEEYKKINNIEVLSESYSETAQKLIWKNTDESNGERKFEAKIGNEIV